MKERIFYYDVLKAFSIFVVIMGHVLMYSLHMQGTMIWKVISVVNMPMFMFVIGLLTKTPSTKGCIKRLRSLLLPTLVVGLIYTCVKGHAVFDFFMSTFHYGYWFCLTLFMYYLFTFGTFKLLDVLKVSAIRTRCFLFWMLVVMLLALSRITPYDNNIVQALSLQLFFKNLPFFAFGVTLRLLPGLKDKIESNNYIFSLSLVLLVVATYIAIGNAIGQLVISACYINVMAYFFYQICNNRRSRLVEYVAKRTLDIYLFHYFLLPAFIVAIPSTFNPDTNILLTLVVVILLSSIVLAGTLTITKFIELSKLLSLLMLGKLAN